MSPGASRYRAEQERGSGLTPGPHSVNSVVTMGRITKRQSARITAAMRAPLAPNTHYAA